MLIKTFGSAIRGIDAIPITIEVNVDQGINFLLVGLPDNAVKESQQRIDAALKNNNYKIPGKKIVINMAPADIRKEGSAYDLPLAIGILAASGQIEKSRVHEYIIMGELSLDGSLKRIKGALPMAIEARNQGFKGIILPEENAKEAAIVDRIQVYGVENIKAAIDFLNYEKDLEVVKVNTRNEFFSGINDYPFDFEDVKGQENVKRALEVCAAGMHNALMAGPPGAGKTMLAKRIPSILPPLSLHEALETTKIHSVGGKMKRGESLKSIRPFIAPHHTISDVALVGGGRHPQPGAISLAHNGLLFLDELPEFKRSVLEVLRQPLEERLVTISRARFTVDYPASFMLIAAMNPCHCGYYNHPAKECMCSGADVDRYWNRISGPLLDRIDIHMEVVPVDINELSKRRKPENSKAIRQRVAIAKEIQNKRFKEIKNVHCNAQMTPRQIRKICLINQTGENLLKNAMEKLGLSARAYDRILKVSRTIADLEQQEHIMPEHLAEAIQYRTLDRDSWGK